MLALRSDGRRQRITYSFGSGNDAGAFEINSNNGLIRVRDNTGSKLDAEGIHGGERRLVIVARTDGAQPIYAYTTVWITLKDENDNSPHFTQESYAATVWEGNNKGTFVMQVRATNILKHLNFQVWRIFDYI